MTSGDKNIDEVDLEEGFYLRSYFSFIVRGDFKTRLQSKVSYSHMSLWDLYVLLVNLSTRNKCYVAVVTCLSVSFSAGTCVVVALVWLLISRKARFGYLSDGR